MTLLLLSFLAGFVLLVMGIIRKIRKNPAKKMFIGWAICTVIFFISFAMIPTNQSNESAKSEQTNDKPEMEKPKEDIKLDEETQKKYDEIVENVEKEMQEEQKYEEAITANKVSWVPVLKDFSEWSIEGGNNSSLFLDENYKKRGYDLTAQMKNLVNEARAINAPATKTETHKIYMRAMDNFEFIADNLMTGVENIDADLITECMNKMNAASNLLEQYNSMMNS